MEFVKIIALTVLAAIAYGEVHDQITIRVCAEYFTVFHPRIIDSDSLTLIAATWGVVATWWVGLPIGIILGASARIGRNKLPAIRMLPYIGRLLLFMAVCALAFGIAGYFYGSIPAGMERLISPEHFHTFAADWWAHSASYASGFFGGVALCVIIAMHRMRNTSTTMPASTPPL